MSKSNTHDFAGSGLVDRCGLVAAIAVHVAIVMSAPTVSAAETVAIFHVGNSLTDQASNEGFMKPEIDYR